MSVTFAKCGSEADYRLSVKLLGGRALEVTAKPVGFNRILRHEALKNGFRSLAARPALTPEEEETKRLDNIRRASSRAKQGVRHLVTSMGGDHLLTLTYRENVTDDERATRDFASFVRLVRARYPNWCYVSVREYQERGAIHFHVSVKGHQPINYLRRCWYKALGSSPDSSGSDTPGAVNVRAQKSRRGRQSSIWGTQKLAAYMSKYISKSFETKPASGMRRYNASREILRPFVRQYWIAASGPYEALCSAFDIAVLNHAGDRRKDYSFWLSDDLSFGFLRMDMSQEVPF